MTKLHSEKRVSAFECLRVFKRIVLYITLYALTRFNKKVY